MTLPEITLYTDGATNPNPGRGGYGAIIIFGKEFKELSGGFSRTTNNRMELYAVIAGLEALKKSCKVHVYSDSQYVVNTVNKNWKRNKNRDLWKRLQDQLYVHEVHFNWVKGHAGNPLNERADALAASVLSRVDLPEDEGYG